MRNKKRYAVVRDCQGGDFGCYRLLTIGEWRQQAIDWAELDEEYGVVKELKKLPKRDIIDYIAELWTLELAEIDVNKWIWDYQTNELVLYNESNNKLKTLFVIKNFTRQDYERLPKQDTRCLDAIIERLNHDWGSFCENNNIETTIFN